MLDRRNLRLVALLLAVVALLTGCAGATPRSPAAGESAVVVASGPDAPGDGLEQARRHHGSAAGVLFVFFCVVLVLTLIVDVITLPCTAPAHHAFWCTHGVIIVIHP